MGVTLERDLKIGLLQIKHTGLIQLVIEEVGLDYGMSKGKFTPSEDKPLVKVYNGEPAIWVFRYRSVLGILLYISGTDCPYFFLDVNCMCPVHVYS